MLVTTTAVQYAAWSQGRKAPVIAIPSTRTNSPTPLTQLSSRGRLYEPEKNVRTMCRPITNSRMYADQR